MSIKAKKMDFTAVRNERLREQLREWFYGPVEERASDYADDTAVLYVYERARFAIVFVYHWTGRQFGTDNSRYLYILRCWKIADDGRWSISIDLEDHINVIRDKLLEKGSE